MTSANLMSEAPITAEVAATTDTETAATDNTLFPCVSTSTTDISAAPESPTDDDTVTVRDGDTEVATATVSAAPETTKIDDAVSAGGDETVATTDNGARPHTRSSSTRPRRQRRCETGSASASAVSGPWFNADQAAEYLALPTAKAVYQAARRGEIPAYRFGKRLRFKRDELDDLLNKGRVLTPPDEGLSSLARRPLAGEGR